MCYSEFAFGEKTRLKAYIHGAVWMKSCWWCILTIANFKVARATAGNQRVVVCAYGCIVHTW
jgi:hypothetical protein